MSCAPRHARSTLSLATVLTRADRKLVAECAGEIRDVAEAAVERDLKDAPRLAHQTHGGATQARAQHVLMRRDASYTIERAQEVIDAETRRIRQPIQAPR